MQRSGRGTSGNLVSDQILQVWHPGKAVAMCSCVSRDVKLQSSRDIIQRRLCEADLFVMPTEAVNPARETNPVWVCRALLEIGYISDRALVTLHGRQRLI